MGYVITYGKYHPFGTTSYQDTNGSVSAAAKRYRYTGMERDDETGLSYHNARYYIPWLGRWLSCDPIDLEGGINVYAYCYNNPIGHSDKSGTQTDPYAYKSNSLSVSMSTGLNKVMPDSVRALTKEGLEKAQKAQEAAKVNEALSHLIVPKKNEISKAQKEEARRLQKIFPMPEKEPVKRSATEVRIEGAVQTVTGGMEASVGAAIIPGSAATGVGPAVGGLLLLHGADEMSTGINKMITGEEQQTLTEQTLSEMAQAAGFDRISADQFASTASTMISIMAGGKALYYKPDALAVNMRNANFVKETVVIAEANAAKGGTTGFRYMTEGELKAIQETGMLRGGNPGKTYFTKDLYKSGINAQQRLSLPTTPTMRVEFEILNNPR